MGSQGTIGLTGLTGYTGSASTVAGSTGYTGSIGYTGSVPGPYVSSITAGTGTAVSTATGAVTVWIGQAVGTNNNVTFNTVSDAGGNLRNFTINSTSSNYTLVLADSGNLISFTSGTITVAANVFPAPYGQTVTLYNNSTSTRSISQGAGAVLRLGGTASTGTRTLLQYGLATVVAVSSNTFVISGVGLS